MKKCMGMTPFTEDERLGMSHAQREPSTQALYVAVWRAAPSPLCSSSTPQRLPFSLGRAEGEVGPLLSGGILRGDCKGCDCVGLYFCGEEEGVKREKEQARGRQRGVVEESLDTDSLVNQEPQRARGRGEERKENATIIMKRAEQQKPAHWMTSPVLFSSSSYVFLRSSLSVTPIWLHARLLFRSITRFCPHPHPSLLDSHPPPLHYKHSINRESQRDVWGRSRYYLSSFLYHQSYTSPYNKEWTHISHKQRGFRTSPPLLGGTYSQLFIAKYIIGH